MTEMGPAAGGIVYGPFSEDPNTVGCDLVIPSQRPMRARSVNAMSDLHEHVVEAIDKHLREWTDPVTDAYITMPGTAESTRACVAALAQKIMAEVTRHRSAGYGPASARVPASELRRPNLPGMRPPDLGTEATPQ